MNTKEWSAGTKRKSFISPAPKSFSNPIDQANYNLGLVGTIFFVVINKPLYNSREYFLYGNYIKRTKMLLCRTSQLESYTQILFGNRSTCLSCKEKKYVALQLTNANNFISFLGHIRMCFTFNTCTYRPKKSRVAFKRNLPALQYT